MKKQLMTYTSEVGMSKSQSKEISYEFVQELYGSSEKQLEYLLNHLEEKKDKHKSITPELITEFHELISSAPFLDSSETNTHRRKNRLMKREMRFKRTFAEIEADRLLQEQAYDLIMKHIIKEKDNEWLD